jgi:hypothetical protein
MVLKKSRYVRHLLWGDTLLPVYLGTTLMFLAVSCMFISTAVISQARFLLYTPLLALPLLLVGAWYEKKATPRAAAWVAAWLLMALTGLLAAGITAVLDERSFGNNLLICGGWLLIPTAVVGWQLWRAWQAYRQALADSAAQMLSDLVQLRGEVTLRALDEELKLGAEQVAEVAREVIESGQLAGMVDEARQRVYSLEELARKEATLAAIIAARGQADLETLMRELNASRDLVQQWLRQLARRGHLAGYVDWENGIVYSQAREKLQQLSTCPLCAAPLSLAGLGVIRCQYCANEIFL